MQLKFYAKYTDVSKVQQDDTLRTYAICEADLNDTYYFHYRRNGRKSDEVFYFLIATLLVPVISIILTATIVRSLYKGIHVRINRKSNHQNLAGFVLVGIFVTFYIIALDCAAVYYAYSGNNELNDVDFKLTLNFMSTCFLLAYDGIVCLMPLTILLYICCSHFGKNTERPNSPKRLDKFLNSCSGCLNKCMSCLHQVFRLYFNVIFGSLNQDEMWEDNKKKLRLPWILTLSFIAPLFAINSHITFILVSWLTDTRRASSIALVYFAMILYLFFMFRQCYTANAKNKHDYFCWSFFLPFYPLCQCYRFVCACFCFCSGCKDCRKIFKANAEYIPLIDFTNENYESRKDERENAGFNTKAFCVLFTWGWVLVASVALVVAAFLVLPIITFDLLSDLLNTFQIFIILVSLLITYKILTLNEPDVLRFLRRMRDAYRSSHDDRENVEALATRNQMQDHDDQSFQAVVKKVQDAVNDTITAVVGAVKHVQKAVDDAETAVDHQAAVNSAQEAIRLVQTAVEGVQRMEDTQAVVTEAQEAVRKINKAVEDSSEPMQDAQRAVEDVQTAMKEAKSAVENVQEAVKDAKGAVENVKAAVKDIDIKAVEGAKTAMKKVQTAMNSVKKIVNDIQEPVTNAKITVNGAITAMKGVQEAVTNVQKSLVGNNVEESVEALQTVNRNIDGTVRIIGAKVVNVREKVGCVQPAKRGVVTQKEQLENILGDVQAAVRDVEVVIQAVVVQVKVKDEEQVDDVEAAGFMMGKMMEVVVHKYN